MALLASAQKLFDKYDNLADPWMTLAGYFNSIRELAGTRRLVEDDIRARLRDADQRGLAKRQIRHTDRAYLFDNSRHGGDHLWVAEVTDGHDLELKCDPMPQWFQTAVWSKINPATR